MMTLNIRLFLLIGSVFWLSHSSGLHAQNTKIRGFIDIGARYDQDKVSFDFGEYDLFVTSELNENFSFLGETIFRYNRELKAFEVGIERAIINYNYKGNHSILIGKQHTPIVYWNETYHHGRVFFPTVARPLLFEADIIPLHTTGIAFQGLNLGRMRFGYNVLIGNGLGAEDITDNDKYKSVTAAIHIKPADRLQIGATFYYDIISEGAQIHHHIVDEKTRQQIYTGSLSYFGSTFEMLAEASLMNNNTDSEGINTSFASYLYSGYRIRDKWVPYVRLDYLEYQDADPYLDNSDTVSFITGLRYEVNYLIVVKLEYQHEDQRVNGSLNKLTAQVAIGF
jgi:hypothetical protein